MSLASVTKKLVITTTPKRSNNCAKRSLSFFKTCLLAYFQKKVASDACGRPGSVLVVRNALTRRAVAESDDLSGFAEMESRAF